MIQNIENQLLNVSRGISSMRGLKEDIEQRQSFLKSRTLLLFEPCIGESLLKTIQSGNLGKFYSYKTCHLKFEEADSLIASGGNGFAYALVVPAGIETQGKILYNYLIVDAHNGQLLYFSPTAVVGSNGAFHQGQLLQLNGRFKKS